MMNLTLRRVRPRLEAYAAVCDSLDASVAQRRPPMVARFRREIPEFIDPMRNKIDKRTQELTFDGVLSTLGNERFDVSPAAGGANAPAGARRVSKYGCAAEIAPGPGESSPVRLLARAGWVLNGEISRLADHGYQKFLETGKLRIPATAEHLRCIQRFDQELRLAIGAMSLYNESLGTTSDVYNYDRLKGRETV